MDADLKRAYQREWHKAKRKGLQTIGIMARLKEEGFAPAYSGEKKTNDFEREYARRMAHARYHGRPTEGIRRELRREYELAGKPIPSTPRKSKHSTVPKEVDTTMSDEEFAAHVHSALMKYRKDMKELAARRKQQERERRAMERQERKERRAEIRREWDECRKTRTCITCKHAYEKGVCQSNGASILACGVTGFGTQASYPACADYDEEYINAICDI